MKRGVEFRCSSVTALSQVTDLKHVFPVSCQHHYLSSRFQSLVVKLFLCLSSMSSSSLSLSSSVAVVCHNNPHILLLHIQRAYLWFFDGLFCTYICIPSIYEPRVRRYDASKHFDIMKKKKSLVSMILAVSCVNYS